MLVLLLLFSPGFRLLVRGVVCSMSYGSDLSQVLAKYSPSS
jgi:hypothetical protein